MNCEFEEKRYEQPLNNELADKRRIFPSGQVLEGRIGFDAALYSRNPRFWRLWSRMWWLSQVVPPRRGVPLDDDFWDDAQKVLDQSRLRFKCNLFIQHKRPDFISSHLGREYQTWNHPYFRYDIDAHQQSILYALQQKVALNALVVYACPAFWTTRELIQFIIAGQLVENSNFVEPSRLNNHWRYTFVNAGTNGIAFSEPEEIPGIKLLGEFDRLMKESEVPEQNSKFLIGLSKAMSEVIETIRDKEYSESYYRLIEYHKFPEHQFARSIAIISSFIFLTNISWSIGFELAQE